MELDPSNIQVASTLIATILVYFTRSHHYYFHPKSSLGFNFGTGQKKKICQNNWEGKEEQGVRRKKERKKEKEIRMVPISIVL